MLNDNFVRLIGKIYKPSFKEYPSGAKLFKSDIAIPMPQDQSKFQYLRLTAWGAMAEALAEVAEGSYIKVYGHIEKNTYMAKCRYCGNGNNTYWFEVGVDNFVPMFEE